MIKRCEGTGCYLRFPIQTDAKAVMIKVRDKNKIIEEISVQFSKNRVDYWENLFVGEVYEGREIWAEIEEGNDIIAGNYINAIEIWDNEVIYKGKKPDFHFTRGAGYLGPIIKIEKSGMWKMTYLCNPYGLSDSCLKEETVSGSSLFHLGKDINPAPEHSIQSKNNMPFINSMPFINGRAEYGKHQLYEGNILSGDIEEAYLFHADNKDILIARSRELTEDIGYKRVYSIPFHLASSDNKTGLVPAPGLNNLRIWKRDFSAHSLFREELAFRTVPSKWPNIRILESDGGTGEITAESFEIEINIHSMDAGKVTIYAAGIHMVWDRQESVLSSSEYIIPVQGKNKLQIKVYSDYRCGEILCEGQALFILKKETAADGYQPVDNDISGNLERCVLMERKVPYICINTEKEKTFHADITVYGMQSGVFSDEIKSHIKPCIPDEKVLFESETFTVFEKHISDKNYGDPDAWAVNEKLVYSPSRVTEEFVWRDTPWGDMVRSINRTSCFMPDTGIEYYPAFHTGYPVLDAAWNIALDNFVQCKSSRYALEGQTGMWSAGLFQGEKEGFGVWMRDSAHIALRGGNLIDPYGAEKTLLYAINKGFDNGSDGCAMAACGIWNHYMASGNPRIIFEAWNGLVANMERADQNYAEDMGLIKAEQSTSNDSLPEPENSGFCLATECYYMLAYEAMDKMGAIVGEKDGWRKHWKQRAQTMREAIRRKYWNEKFGYFTSGPVGSEAYEKGLWETSGEEAVIWPRFRIASDKQRDSVLRKLKETAMCEYGIILFPHKEKLNHFCGSVWTVWEAGFAAAAAKNKNTELIWKLIAQQIRNCIINKTFYEVIDAESGKAWRWPGQLWHAAGFLSLILFGLLGLEYTEAGITLNPCIPNVLNSMSLNGLHYRKAILNIKTEGTGEKFNLYMDGEQCNIIPADIMGMHEIIIKE